FLIVGQRRRLACLGRDTGAWKRNPHAGKRLRVRDDLSDLTDVRRMLDIDGLHPGRAVTDVVARGGDVHEPLLAPQLAPRVLDRPDGPVGIFGTDLVVVPAHDGHGMVDRTYRRAEVALAEDPARIGGELQSVVDGRHERTMLAESGLDFPDGGDRV